ncbi:MAG TPA: hypothetical protein ENI23_10730 [bacterium]|nr:hypothetical protein [bacterium]
MNYFQVLGLPLTAAEDEISVVVDERLKQVRAKFDQDPTKETQELLAQTLRAGMAVLNTVARPLIVDLHSGMFPSEYSDEASEFIEALIGIQISELERQEFGNELSSETILLKINCGETLKAMSIVGATNLSGFIQRAGEVLAKWVHYTVQETGEMSRYRFMGFKQTGRLKDFSQNRLVITGIEVNQLSKLEDEIQISEGFLAFMRAMVYAQDAINESREDLEGRYWPVYAPTADNISKEKSPLLGNITIERGKPVVKFAVIGYKSKPDGSMTEATLFLSEREMLHPPSSLEYQVSADIPEGFSSFIDGLQSLATHISDTKWDRRIRNFNSDELQKAINGINEYAELHYSDTAIPITVSNIGFRREDAFEGTERFIPARSEGIAPNEGARGRGPEIH